MASRSKPSFWRLPVTKSGWWAVALAIVYTLMGIVYMVVVLRLPANAPGTSTVVPNFVPLMMVFGLAAGVVGLIALIRNHERSWLAWLSILPGVTVLVLLLGDLLLTH